MTKTNFTQPVILCPNPDLKGLGMFISQDTQFIVEVYRKAGRACYTYSLNNKCQFIDRVTPSEVWELISEHLSATIVHIDRKFFNKQFKQEIKTYKEGKL